MARRPKTLFEFLGISDPAVQDFATRMASEWLAPGLANAARAVRRGVRFPQCNAHGCEGTGVGVCEVCTKSFCAGHGLLFVPDILEPDTLTMRIEEPVGGLCIACSQQAVAAYLEQMRRNTKRTQPRPEPPPRNPGPFGESPPYMPKVVLDAYLLLGLDWRSASPETIRKRQRQLARTQHPDVAGEGQDMSRINAAAEVAVRWATDHPVEA